MGSVTPRNHQSTSLEARALAPNAACAKTTRAARPIRPEPASAAKRQNSRA